MQVRNLDGVHAAEHQDAQREENPVLQAPAEAEAVVLRAVRLAQPGKEKVERAGGACQLPPASVKAKRENEPWQREGNFASSFEPRLGQKIAPGNLAMKIF